MENKKLLNFLLKDIAEIEELFAEKGSSGFDGFEIDFIRSRFEGAKKIIRILEDQQGNEIMPEQEDIQPEPKEADEDLSVGQFQAETNTATPETEQETFDAEPEPEQIEILQETETELPENGTDDEVVVERAESVESEEVVEVEELKTNEQKRLGDKFAKEKSLNDLLSDGGSNKLENKLSNSPVSSLQGAIGINDRYIFIRELFEGSAEKFSTAVTELDKLQNIQEAVNYLQQNYRWKKTDASLKFVNLVKRRFPNG